MTYSQDAAGPALSTARPLEPRQRTGARLAGLALGLVLALGPVAMTMLFLVVREWTDGALIAVAVVMVVALPGSWTVGFAVLRAAGVRRPLAVTWWAWSIAVATGAVSAVVFGSVAWLIIMVQAVVLWSGGAYDWCVGAAAGLTVGLTLLVSVLATPSLAASLAPRPSTWAQPAGEPAPQPPGPPPAAAPRI